MPAAAPGPGSFTWRYAGDARILSGAGYALLLQVSHPTVGAGVAEHSNFAEDPWGRLWRTLDFTFLLSFGGPEASEATGRAVREMHKRIKGVKPDGSRYHALEPEPYAWVHATLFKATIDGHRHFGCRLGRADLEGLWSEWLVLGSRLGVREGDLPASYRDFPAYFDAMVDERLEDNQVVQDVLATLTQPKAPPLPFMSDPAWRALRFPFVRASALATAGMLPPLLRRRFGIRWTRAQDLELRAIGAASRGRHPADARAPAQHRPGLPEDAPRGDRPGRFRSGRRAPGSRGVTGPVSGSPASVLALALDPRVEPPDDAVSNRVLDAALALAAASGLRSLTMDDVARRAGVGRMTVYRRFGDKAALVQALSVRESRRCLAELDAAAPPDAPIADQVAEGFVTALRISREHPLLNRLARLEPETVLATFAAPGSEVFAAMRTFLAARLHASQEAGVLEPIDVEQTAELLVRVTLSFVLIQDTVLPVHDDESAREVARRLVLPLLRG